MFGNNSSVHRNSDAMANSSQFDQQSYFNLSQSQMYTADASDKNSEMFAYHQRESSNSFFFDKRKSVFSIYEDVNKLNCNSIFSGGLDTGIDFGKFVYDTSNNIGTTAQI